MDSKITLSAFFLAIVVIMLGAYTRLTDAGLGCPDWPLCYGSWFVPYDVNSLLQAQAYFPNTTVDTIKALTEMIHRYCATLLGILVLIIGILTWKNQANTQQKTLAALLTMMVILQGLLGMWTVTLKLFPLVVMAHLVGGLCTLSLLWTLWHVQNNFNLKKPSESTHKFVIAGLILLFIQIILGGWTSANYAALSCPNFPLCTTKFLPKWDVTAFDIWSAIRLENPLTFLSLEARQTIHMLHRLGAVCVLCIFCIISRKISKYASNLPHPTQPRLNLLNKILIFLVFAQLGLGMLNVILLLPLHIALLHNMGAFFLLIITLRIFFILPKRSI
ncbi:MAG TPA: COX15/CtaA family protein [Gammaproteobacteria bacterium]|nr:COX15/CtaA family protein [Gammaproteobacteria bacterium]